MPLSDYARERAQAQLVVCTLRNTPAQDISTARLFGPFEPGDQIAISSQGEFFAQVGTASVVATDASTPLPSGVWHFTFPDGATHLSLFASSTTLAAAWASGV